MRARRALGLLLSMMAWTACFEVKDVPSASGGETNFLRACEDTCADGLSCVCGVCTRSCTSNSACERFGSNAVCLSADAVGDTRSCEPDERKRAAVCDARCITNRDCPSEFSCQRGLCREAQRASEGPSDAAMDAGSTGSGDALEPNAPFVMLLVDTSGSLSDMPNCTCASSSDCTNCEPDCAAAEQNRWFTMLAALTGSYENFGCQRVERTSENGATYDQGYMIPNYVVSATTRQRGDGLIDAFATRVQFGLATFDSEATYTGGSNLIPRAEFDFAQSGSVSGMFSYAGGDSTGPRIRPDGTEVGRVFYPGCTSPYYVDTGIRSARATEGALLVQNAGDTAAIRSQQLREQLLRARPYSGTPIAAALDDLYFYFTQDPARSSVASARKHVVLLTDGVPDPDFRDLRCDCSPPEECGAESDQLSCPYPKADVAAQHLRCGFDGATCSGPIAALHIVALNVDGAAARGTLDAVAAAGGDRARYASDQAELRAALREVFEAILAE